MKQDGDDPRGAPHDPDEESLAEVQRIAAQFIRDWQQSGDADATAALAQNPELGRHKSIVLDLAYEEYCQRIERGETVDIEQFVGRFADYSKSLLRQLELHQLLDDCPKLTDVWFATVWPEVPGKFLNFEILECLGEGAFGRVYLATEPALGNRLVAVKVSPSALEEADILGKLDHPHIVRVHSVQLDERTGLSAICMPFLGRATLCDVLDRIGIEKQVPDSAQVIDEAIVKASSGRQPAGAPAKHRRDAENYVDTVLMIGMQLADALAFAHRHGVYHLDLKPSNVLLTDDGRPMLLDFNLAHDQQKATARQGGALPYMSPEQLALFRSPTAELRQSDLAPADVYSLGVVLYELLTGQLPFPVPKTAVTNDQRAAALIEAQRRGAIALRSLNPRVPESLARLVEKCLACNAAHRFAGAGELAAAIRAEYGVVRRSLRWVGRHRRLVTATALLLCCASVLGVSYAQHRSATYYLRQIALGEEFQRQGNYAEAIHAFDRAYEDHPEAMEILGRRAEARIAQGDFVRANLDLQKLLDHGEDAQVMVLAAYCLQMSGSHSEAAMSYRRAIESGLDSALVRNNLGDACYQSADYVEAKLHLERTVAIDPSLQAAHHNLAKVEARLAEFRREKPIAALAAIERAAELGEASAELLLDAAAIHAQAIKYDPSGLEVAVKWFRRAIDAGTPIEVLSAYPKFELLKESLPTQAANTVAPTTSVRTNVRLVNPLGIKQRPTGTIAGVIAGRTP